DTIQAPIIEVLGSPNLARLRSLALRNPSRGGGKATLRALIWSEHLGELRRLTLGDLDELLSKRGADWFADWPGLARLESLALVGRVGLDNAVLARIARS